MPQPSAPGEIHVVGAGPAGLSAALTAVSSGARVVVSERRGAAGARFHGDLQGIENWTTEADVLEELASIGIEPSFPLHPVREGLFFDPDGREYFYRSARPVLYLARRGPEKGSLDRALEEQARARGVTIRFGEHSARLPEGGIVAGGPRGADAISVGWVFETDMPDGIFAAMSEQLAPGGYAYLLVAGGRGTVASCLFRSFAREREYRERTVEFFQKRAGLRMREPIPFGGAGNTFVPATARQGRILFAGEAAGFQDSLWGFGIRIAILSGHLAARALLAGAPEQYDRLWRERLGGLLRASLVNRCLYGRLRDAGYRLLLRSIARSRDPRERLRKHYAESPPRRLFYPVARRLVVSARSDPVCPVGGCSRIWCRGHGPDRRSRRGGLPGLAEGAAHPAGLTGDGELLARADDESPHARVGRGDVPIS
jgi:flavin-dependent dehydrogenase